MTARTSAGSSPSTEVAPAGGEDGWRYELDRRARRLDRGRVLAGGEPFRLVRLSESGVEALEALLGVGAPLPDHALDLVRGLAGTALLHPVPPRRLAACGCFAIAAVVPAHDPPPGLARLLEGLAGGGIPVQVVDDGSGDGGAAAARAAAAAGAGARCVRRSVRGGPAAARNTEAPEADLLAFVDADAVLDPADPTGWIATCASHFHDEAVALVSPRVQVHARPAPTGTARDLERYESLESPLDLGPHPGIAGASRRLSYVPAAVLLARRRALEEVGWFREGMRYGEDVDLVRRLEGAGFVTRYEPQALVGHCARPTLRSFVRQRAGYGSAAAAIDASHRGTVAPFASSPLPAVGGAGLVATATVLARRPRASALAAASLVTVAGLGATAARLQLLLVGSGVAPADAIPDAARLAARATSGAALGMLSGVRRAWWPMLLPLLAWRRSRAAAASLAVTSSLAGHLLPAIASARKEASAASAGRRLLVHLALGVLDDTAYGTGVWWGCARRRSLRAVAPRITRRPRVPRGPRAPSAAPCRAGCEGSGPR